MIILHLTTSGDGICGDLCGSLSGKCEETYSILLYKVRVVCFNTLISILKNKIYLTSNKGKPINFPFVRNKNDRWKLTGILQKSKPLASTFSNVRFRREISALITVNIVCSSDRLDDKEVSNLRPCSESPGQPFRRTKVCFILNNFASKCLPSCSNVWHFSSYKYQKKYLKVINSL